jgi:hypothetical protein
LLTTDELIALRDALYRMRQPDPPLRGVRDRLTRMQADLENEPMRREIEAWMDQMQAKMDTLRRKLSPPG